MSTKVDFFDVRLKDVPGWQKWVDANADGGYGEACICVAHKVMQLMDALPTGSAVDANALVHTANRELAEGITGFMAGAVASMVSACAERGEEFRRSWNHEVQLGTEGGAANDSGGVLNPALINLGGK